MRTVRHVMSVVGTRPNFMKIAPIVAELAPAAGRVRARARPHRPALRRRDVASLLRASSASASRTTSSASARARTPQQTARVMERLEPVLLERERRTSCSCPGDVNSTLAAALVAAKLGIPVGARRGRAALFDRTMPEEINRILTDAIATCSSSTRPRRASNLLREGAPGSAIHFVGNTMIDTLVAMRERIAALGRARAAHGLDARATTCVVTLHRPALVDGPLLADAMARARRRRPRACRSSSRSTRARAARDRGARARRPAPGAAR